ncbi:MAG: o-succinylbenzoate synthase [Opitutae bacterium]|nr:o-succinylbenzoate synthase [Opitutae bacterium]MBT4667301.1 o-succinylbenzoate synthase [Opitutae bacterium]MBT6851458.1 o-succinylbenzoate synthase [Opitutae bacterium]MBT7742781.1 o-succinylbenzoate synthase [Opitutae bacterium]
MIDSFEVKPLRRNFREPFATATGTWRTRESIVVRVKYLDGHIGFGEVAPTLGFRGETISDAQRFLSIWEPQMEIPDYLPLCRAALGCADSSLWRTQTAFPKIKTAALLRSSEETNLPLNNVLKAKIGVGELGSEIATIENLLTRLPAGSRLRLDANGSLSRTEAKAWLDTFEGCSQIEFLEQPLAATDRNGLMGLAESNSLALALDESLLDIQIAEEFLADGWPGYFVFKPTLSRDWREMEIFLRNEPTRCVVSSVFESPFGFEAVLRVASMVETVAGIGVNTLFVEDNFSLHDMDIVLQPGTVDIPQLEELWLSI